MQGIVFVSHTKNIQRALLASVHGVFSSFHYALVAFLLRRQDTMTGKLVQESI